VVYHGVMARSTGSQNPRPRRDRRRIYGTAILVAMVAGTVGGAVLAIGGGDDRTGGGNQRSAPTTPEVDLSPATTLDPSTLSAEAQELLALVEAGRVGTFHVVYEARSSELDAAGSSAVLELWRRGEEVRQETVLTEAGVSNRMIAIGGPAGTISCEQPPGQELACRQVSDEALGPTDDLLATIVGLLPTGEVTARDETVAASAARCFAVVDGDTEAELCLNADGVPLRIADDVLVLEATMLDRAVTDATFVP